jgi:hypothetical protein
MGIPSKTGVLAALVIAVLLLHPVSGGEKIKVLATGNLALLQNLQWFFKTEPLIDMHMVVSKDYGVSGAEEILKLIRQYFPRNYERMKAFDYIMLTQPEFQFFTTKQDKWMYDLICEGAGGINDGSVFSIIVDIHSAWGVSMTSKAFPNDADAVIMKGAGEANGMAFRITIEQDCPIPILTPFIKYGVEKVACSGVSRMVIKREGAEYLAYQSGNFFGRDKVGYLAVWDYEKGRTITSGDFLGSGWLAYPSGPDSNQYSPEILMNMILYCTHRDLIDDIDVFHRLKSNFGEYQIRLAVLVSLRDFIDKFGANTGEIQTEIRKLQDTYTESTTHYLDQEFVESEEAILSGLEQFAESEEIARRAKDAALFWVYLIEWLVASSTFFISGFVLWTLMVRRRLYRDVQATRLRERA